MTNTALTTMENFRLPALNTDDVFSKEDLQEDMEGLRISFQKVKIPGSGGLQFEISGDDPENPDYSKFLEGIILYNHAAGAYWQEGSEYDDNSLPLCSTVDGKLGSGDPGGLCSACPHNQFGTGKEGRGKACKNMRVLYLLRDGEFLPLQLSLPPTSIRPYNDFFNSAFATRRRATYGSLVQIGLKREENGSQLYSVATFKKIGDFSGEKLMEVKAYADDFRSQIKLILQQRAADAEFRQEDNYVESGYAVNDTAQGFSITASTINGDREQLPA